MITNSVHYYLTY